MHIAVQQKVAKYDICGHLIYVQSQWKQLMLAGFMLKHYHLAMARGRSKTLQGEGHRHTMVVGDAQMIVLWLKSLKLAENPEVTTQ